MRCTYLIIMGDPCMKNKKKRRLIATLLCLIVLVSGILILPVRASKAVGVGQIQLSCKKTHVAKGEAFTVVCRVTSATGVLEADFFVDYNTAALDFSYGGAKATKETGGVHIASLDNTDSPIRRTFSLQFIAKEYGDANIFIRDGARVMDGEGNAISLSTERLVVQVDDGGDPTPEPVVTDTGEPNTTMAPGETAPAKATPIPGKSGKNKLISVTTNAKSMKPEFDPDVKKYRCEVESDQDTFFIEYQCQDSKAKVKIKGNKNLKYGENKVRVIVTAPNKDKRTYTFYVTRLAAQDVGDDAGDKPTVVAVSQAAVQPDGKPLDKVGVSGYSIVLYLIILVLAIFSVAMVMLVRRQRREIYEYEEMLEEEDETEDDRRSGKSDIESGEVRGEDGEPGDRDGTSFVRSVRGSGSGADDPERE